MSLSVKTGENRPVVVSVAMGYGHLRAAMPLAEVMDVPLLRADEPPLAEVRERNLWKWMLGGHSLLSKPLPLPVLGTQLKSLGMDWLTRIAPLYPQRDQSRPDLGALAFDVLAALGLGRGVVDYLKREDVPLLTTFYAPALAADLAGLRRIYCVVTDSDVQRVWVAREPRESNIHYLAPSYRVVRRLRAYGVPSERITLTGFPLPPSLLGGPDSALARSRLAERMVRLDPEGSFRSLHGPDLERLVGPMPRRVDRPLRLVFAVGGAGIQVELADEFLRSLADWVRQERLQITLVAGMRDSVAGRLRRAVQDAGLGQYAGRRVRVLHEPQFEDYYAAFNDAVGEADLLWTKPSELSFYGALGLPLVLAPPVGIHERYNRRYLRRFGIGLKQERASHARGWLGEWLADGTLAGAAWSGFLRMPKEGTWRIAAALGVNVAEGAKWHESLRGSAPTASVLSLRAGR
jgi:hypothetical protein